ncbi:MAG: phage terminase large subunit [Candidatus Limnocylindrales bacterium]
MTREYRELLRRMAAHDDAAFAEYVGDLLLPDHLAEASAFADRHGSALILLPRGHGKSTLFIWRTARLIGVTHGRVRVLLLAAVAEDAEALSGAIRRIVESERFTEVFPWARAGARGLVWTDRRWSVAGTEALHGKDATCRAEGLLSIRPGPRADILLADDIVGEQECTTATMRAKVSTTYWSVVDPILVPDSPALREALASDPALGWRLDPDGTLPGRRWFLGTRWHADDPYAELMAAGWPALVRTAIGSDGQALWPELWPISKLEAKRRELGSAIFNLQYQNDPSGMGGNIFKREWFQLVDAVPAGARRIGMDLNASASTRADYTAVVEWVEDADHNLYFVGAWRKQLDEGHRAWLTGRTDSMEPGSTPAYGHPDGPRLLWPQTRLPVGWVGLSGPLVDAPRSVTRLCIEATMFQSAFVGELLARTRLPAIRVYSERDKVTRNRALAPRYEAGKVFHLRSAPGLAEFEDELVTFPNGQHDDQVDAAVYGADLGALEAASPFPFPTGRGWMIVHRPSPPLVPTARRAIRLG